VELLDTPIWNKGTAFDEAERAALGLRGLLPPQLESLQQQSIRAYEGFKAKTTDLERHIYVRQLQDNNETLFYRLLLDHVEEMLPIVYTPTVGLACQQFSHIYRRPRGLIVSYPLRDTIPEILRNRPNREVDVIVVTDGERILGLGDQGVGGLGIPIGKLSLYSLIGGIHPSRTLPIILDVGTNNQERLNDPEYLGWRHERVMGQEYLDFMDRFVKTVKQELPQTCLQWEDFSTPHARPLLERYQNELLTFNDDVQGTAAVVLGAVVSVETSGQSVQYRLLDSMRAYARQKLEQSSEVAALLRRHAQHHLALFRRAEAELENRPPEDWLADYGRCLDDVRAAINWVFSDSGDADLGAALTAVSAPFWIHLSLVDDHAQAEGGTRKEDTEISGARLGAACNGTLRCLRDVPLQTQGPATRGIVERENRKQNSELESHGIFRKAGPFEEVEESEKIALNPRR
jgi:hypothetical protein